MTATKVARFSAITSWKNRETAKQASLTVFLLVAALIFLFPYYYTIISSLREPFYEFNKSNPSFLPGKPSLAAYQRFLNTPLFGMGTFAGQAGKTNSGLAMLGLGFKNTIIFVFAIVGGSTLTSALAAYAFAKMDFIGRRLLFYLFLSTMIVPGEITLVPKYVMFHRWHLLGTYWVLIIPGIVGAGGWFLMRMFMSTIPDAYLDAARIDGANEWHIIRHVMFPMSQPVIFTYMLFTFLGVWNDLMGPLLYVNEPARYTLQLILYVIQLNYNFRGTMDWLSDPSGLAIQMLFASLIISSIPTILVFVVFQKRIVQGITITGLKL